MKRTFKLITLSAILLMLAGSFFSCGEKEQQVEDLLFEIYTLSPTGSNPDCEWTNLNYDNRLIIINSDEKMKEYVDCKGGDYSEIDFSKHTLLLTNGCTNYGIEKIVSLVQHYGDNKYILDVEITLNDAGVIERWALALLVEKLDKDCIIELKVQMIRN